MDDIEKLLSSISLKNECFSNKEIIGKLISQRREAERLRHRRYRYLLFARWSIAASVAVVLTIILFIFNAPMKFETNSENMLVKLPDGSEVELMKNSELRYNRIQWLLNRNLHLSGNALFSVTTGEKFTVITQSGNVSVLGTEFYVEQQGDNLHVDCYKGRVLVKTNVGSQILKAGESVACNSQEIVFSTQKDSLLDVVEPLPEYLIYDNSKLVTVVEKIEEIYSISIRPLDLCRGLRYTGSLPTANLEEALEIVFNTCDIAYSINGDIVNIRRK